MRPDAVFTIPVFTAMSLLLRDPCNLERWKHSGDSAAVKIFREVSFFSPGTRGLLIAPTLERSMRRGSASSRFRRAAHGGRYRSIAALHVPERLRDQAIAHAHHIHAANRLRQPGPEAIAPANDGALVDGGDVFGRE